ncbi:MAG: prepilin peptidase [Candidatus Bathyarchaeia archaeon]
MQFELLQYTFALAVLIYASVLDFKSREVSNRIWLLAFPASFAFSIVALAVGILNLELMVLSVCFSLGLGLTLFCFGFYGGADAKALLFIALALPAYPTAFKPPIGDLAFIPVITVFFNSTLLSMIYPISIFTLNIKDILRGKNLFRGINATIKEKILLLFTARKISLHKLDESLSYFPLETVTATKEGKLTRKVLHFIKSEEDLSPYINNLKEHENILGDGVLATPTIPFIVFITLALALMPLIN